MRTLKLTLAYEGTNYAGWQVQKNSTQHSAHSRQKPTIQGTLEQTLRQILQESVKVVGSGRTDAGVHALAQVAHLKTRSSMPCERLRRALNSLLPPDIVVKKVEEAPAGFHARFDAKIKRYRYHIVNGPVVLPFERRYVHQVPVSLNPALMRREARGLLGRHDFRAFHNPGRPVADTRRTISALRINRHNTYLVIEIEATGFLYSMVRSIVGTLIDIGRGHRPPGTMVQLLKTKDRRLVGTTAPPQGLCLAEVRY